MKFIQRWGLMRNTMPENIQEHTTQVAMVAHALALLRNRRLPNEPLDPARVALLAVFHDAEEVITGDLPTPVKYFNPQVQAAVGELSGVAKRKLLAMLPAELRADYQPLLFAATEDAEAWRLIKWADKICAYLKCVEEAKAGNREFERAQSTLWQALQSGADPDVAAWLAQFLPSFELTLDELN